MKDALESEYWINCSKSTSSPCVVETCDWRGWFYFYRFYHNTGRDTLKGNAWIPSGWWRAQTCCWLSHTNCKILTDQGSWWCREMPIPPGKDGLDKENLENRKEQFQFFNFYFQPLWFWDMWQARLFLVLKVFPQNWQWYSEGKCLDSKWFFAWPISLLTFPHKLQDRERSKFLVKYRDASSSRDSDCPSGYSPRHYSGLSSVKVSLT